MRILQAIKRFNYGGAENYVRELTNELSSKNNEVFLFSRSGGYQFKLLNSKVHFIEYCFWCSFLIFNILKLLLVIRKHKIQLIHAHQRVSVLSASIAGFLTGTPVVVTVHGRTRYDLRSVLSKIIPIYIIYVSQKTMTYANRKKIISKKSIFIPGFIPKIEPLNSFIPYGIGYYSRMNARHSEIICMLIDIIPTLLSEFRFISLSVYGEGKKLEMIRHKADAVNSVIGHKAIQINGFIDNLKATEKVPELVVGVGRVAIESAMKGCSVISANGIKTGELVTIDNYQFYMKNNFVNVDGNMPSAELLKTLISDFFRNREENRMKSKELIQQMHHDYNHNKLIKEIETLYCRATGSNHSEKSTNMN